MWTLRGEHGEITEAIETLAYKARRSAAISMSASFYRYT